MGSSAKKIIQGQRCISGTSKLLGFDNVTHPSDNRVPDPNGVHSLLQNATVREGGHNEDVNNTNLHDGDGSDTESVE